MANILLLCICFVLGILFRKSKRFPENTSQVLNSFILHVSLPALVLHHIHEIQFSKETLLPALMPWMIFTVAGIFLYALFRFKKLERKTAICLLLTAGLGNTSFVGIPLLETFLGKESIGYAIISDQLGTFLVLSFPGLIFATVADGKEWQIKTLFQRVFTFAPVFALLLAVLSRPFSYPTWFIVVLQRLGDTLSPLALVSVGFLLNLRTMKGHRLHLVLGLGLKLIVLPVITILVYRNFNTERLMYETIVLESAMAPMVTSTIIAIDRNIVPHLAGLMLGIGIPLSFITTYFFLNLMKAGIL
ncbi:permease [Leptospira ognonensis]|uniref:Permease n=1 Tax=Leptospira ognonensis TaxID=2484945 RepID=A0A4R9JVI5_9LEPT|nr:AEC family transporter [Leptospira ognonensis]TGL56321.1 permease [Leptospira ognonensis]